MKIPVSEIFYSIQWEGRNVWVPSIFVRFWWCNLACWYCDSKYSRHKDHIKEMMMKELKQVVKEIKQRDCGHIIFTWWEPALFEKQIEAIMIELWEWYYYEIETNGSIKLTLDYDQVNISYKTSNSGNKPYELKEVSRHWDYKFVVKDLDDIMEVEEIITNYNLPEENVFLMPLGVDKDSQINQIVANYCMVSGYRYCQRTHIILFWNKKWV